MKEHKKSREEEKREKGELFTLSYLALFIELNILLTIIYHQTIAFTPRSSQNLVRVSLGSYVLQVKLYISFSNLKIWIY